MIDRKERITQLKEVLRLIGGGQVLRLPLQSLIGEANMFFQVAEEILSNQESHIATVLETTLQMEVYIKNIYEKGTEGRGYSMGFFGIYEGILNKSPHFR